MTFIFLYVTAPNEAAARNIATHLLQKRLIACANFFPVRSRYWWKGKIKDEQEVVLILKTVKKNAELVKKEIEKMHSYDVPCVTLIDVQPNEKYAKWLLGELH